LNEISNLQANLNQKASFIAKIKPFLKPEEEVNMKLEIYGKMGLIRRG